MGQDLACPSFAPWPTPTAATSTPPPAPTAALSSTCASPPSPRTTGSIPRIAIPHACRRHRNQATRRAQPSRNDHVPAVVGASCASGPESRTSPAISTPNRPRQRGSSRGDSPHAASVPCATSTRSSARWTSRDQRTKTEYHQRAGRGPCEELGEPRVHAEQDQRDRKSVV